MDLDELDARAEQVAYESSESSFAASSSEPSLPSPKRARVAPNPALGDDSEYEEPDFTDLFAAHDVLAQNHARGLANLIAHLEDEAANEEGDDIDLRNNVIVTNNGHLRQRAKATNGILESLVAAESESSSDESSDLSLIDEVERAEARRDGEPLPLRRDAYDRGHTDLEITGMELVRSITDRRAPLLERLIEMSL